MPADAALIDARNAAAVPQKSAGKMRLMTMSSLDGRTVACRRARQLVDAIEADLGGADRLSEGTKQLCQRAAVLGAFVENCEAQWLAGQEVALGDYLAAINSQRRVLATIGIKRVAREIPTLAEHIATLAREHPEATPDDEAVSLDDESASAA